MKLIDIIYAKTGLAFDRGGLADDAEGQALVASLLALVARTDGRVSSEETARMVALLRERFHMGDEEAAELVSRAINDFGSDSDLDGLVANINEELSLPQKEELLSIVLHIIASDNRKHAAEMQLLDELITGLKIPDNILENAYQGYFRDRDSGGN